MTKKRALVSNNISTFLERIKLNDFRDLAKALSFLDQWNFKFSELKPLYESLKNPSFRLGITGPPGAGKSTLINEFIRYFRSKGLTVGVLAVDPSSPFSKGAILGDRIRYSEFFNDEGVFIRSLGSRGSLGGISASAYLMLRAYDLFDFDIVLIESVGVGQTELDIMNVSDLLSVVLVPESGDSIQAMKAGLLEITNLFIVNKSDRPGGESFANELKSTLNLLNEDDDLHEVFLTEAINNKGINEFCEKVLEIKSKIDLQKLRRDPVKLQNESLALLKHFNEMKLKKETQKVHSPKDVVNLLNHYL